VGTQTQPLYRRSSRLEQSQRLELIACSPEPSYRADDTLWENNIYFERAIARFISFLNHHEFSPEQVREVLNDVERECIVKHGYGLTALRTHW